MYTTTKVLLLLTVLALLPCAERELLVYAYVCVCVCVCVWHHKNN